MERKVTERLSDEDIEGYLRSLAKPRPGSVYRAFAELKSLRTRPLPAEVELMWHHLIGRAQFLEAGLPPEGDGVKDLGLKLREAAALLRRLGASAWRPKFEKVWCSQCGAEFGPRDSGYSHCEDHRSEGR